MEAKEAIKIVRKALKELSPTLSVRMARGTGYGWIDISGSGEYGDFTESEREAVKSFGLNPGGNFANISPESRNYYVEKAQTILEQ